MVYINWDEIDENENLLSAGKYVLTVIDVVEKTTLSGDSMWSLQMDPGQNADYVWDNLVFSKKAKIRVKDAWQAFGLETKGEEEIRPETLIGKSALVDVEVGKWNGKNRNTIAFRGYHPISEEQKNNSVTSAEEKLPF